MAAEERVSCREASRLLSLAGERELDEGEVRALDRHLEACLMCRNFASQLEFMRRAARRYGRGE